MSDMSKPTKLGNDERANLLSPKPAELVTLPSFMDCHDHQYTQIVIGLKGTVEFEVSGKGNLVGPGQGCVVTSGNDHAFGGVVGGSDILVLNMPPPTNDDPLILQKLNQLALEDTYFQLDGSIQKLIQMLSIEMQASPDDLLLSRACNDTVIALLQRHMSHYEPSKKESRFSLDAIDRYIEQHLSRKISVAQLAGSVFLAESQFHHLFKTQMGVTPHQYVLGKRIDFAKTLIEKGQYTLGQVAEFTGFSSQSTFTHAFSRLQGMSPRHYKNIHNVK